MIYSPGKSQEICNAVVTKVVFKRLIVMMVDVIYLRGEVWTLSLGKPYG